jgi:hypothetical protein
MKYRAPFTGYNNDFMFYIVMLLYNGDWAALLKVKMPTLLQLQYCW